jgi:hypothetical protein
MSPQNILKHLQKVWDENNAEYSEDSFCEYVSDYCDENQEDLCFTNKDNEEEVVVDWVLHNLDLSR